MSGGDTVEVEPAVVGQSRAERVAFAAALGGMLSLPFAFVLALSLPQPAGLVVGGLAAAATLGGVGGVAGCRAGRSSRSG